MAHMKRGAHLLANGHAGVEGRFVMEILLLLDGTSVGGQTLNFERDRIFVSLTAVEILFS